MGGGVSSGTRSVFAGGSTVGGGNPVTNVIDYVTTQSLGNAVDFGDHTQAKRLTSSVNSPTRGIFAGGYGDSSPYPRYNIIEFITTATLGNAIEFGDMTITNHYSAGSCSSPTRACIGGGNFPSRTDVIEYVQIMTQGDAVDFGNLVDDRYLMLRGCVSTGHGGLG